MLTNNVALVSTYVSYASNYNTGTASSTLSTLTMSNNGSGIWPGGLGLLMLGGTISGGTVSLGYIDPVGNFALVTSLSTSGSATFQLPYGVLSVSSNGGTSAGRTIGFNAIVIPNNIA